jgi:hypothetical protein
MIFNKIKQYLIKLLDLPICDICSKIMKFKRNKYHTYYNLRSYDSYCCGEHCEFLINNHDDSIIEKIYTTKNYRIIVRDLDELLINHICSGELYTINSPMFKIKNLSENQIDDRIKTILLFQ